MESMICLVMVLVGWYVGFFSPGERQLLRYFALRHRRNLDVFEHFPQDGDYPPEALVNRGPVNATLFGNTRHRDALQIDQAGDACVGMADPPRIHGDANALG